MSHSVLHSYSIHRAAPTSTLAHKLTSSHAPQGIRSRAQHPEQTHGCTVAVSLHAQGCPQHRARSTRARHDVIPFPDIALRILSIASRDDRHPRINIGSTSSAFILGSTSSAFIECHRYNHTTSNLLNSIYKHPSQLHIPGSQLPLWSPCWHIPTRITRGLRVYGFLKGLGGRALVASSHTHHTAQHDTDTSIPPVSTNRARTHARKHARTQANTHTHTCTHTRHEPPPLTRNPGVRNLSCSARGRSTRIPRRRHGPIAIQC